MEEMIIVSDIDIERKESIVCRAFNFRVIANLKWRAIEKMYIVTNMIVYMLVLMGIINGEMREK